MTWLTLLHSSSFPIDRYGEMLEHEAIGSRVISCIADVPANLGRLTVILLDTTLARTAPTTRLTARPGVTVVTCGLPETPGWIDGSSIFLELPTDPSPGLFRTCLKRAFERVLDEL